MARRLINSVSGIGAVQAGDLVLRATKYNLSFWATDEPRPPAGDANAAATVDGHIDIDGIAEAAVLSGVDRLTLTLADGRQIPFRLKSSAGEIVGL